MLIEHINLTWEIILIAGIAQAIFLLLFLFIKKAQNKQARQWLIMLLLIAVLSGIDNFLYTSTQFKNWWGICGFSRGSTLLIGPILLFYCRSLFEPQLKFSRKDILHFIPYLVFLSLNIYLLLTISFEIKQATVEAMLNGTTPLGVIDFFILWIYIFHFMAYMTAINAHLVRFIDRRDQVNYSVVLKKRRNWIYGLILYFSLIPLLMLAMIIFYYIRGVGSISINIYYSLVQIGFIYGLSYLYFNQNDLVLAGFKKRYASLSGIKGKGIIKNLYALMEKKKMYLDPDLRLAKLAKLLNISSHQLSQIINSELGKTFPDFVNAYRVKEVQKMIQNNQYPSFSILGIAYEAGFNSKSSFNKAFKKETGVTPSDYKLQNLC